MTMDPGNHEQTELLRGIWNELKTLGSSLGGRIDAVRTELGDRIDQTNARIDAVRTELGDRIDQTNARLDQTNARLGVVEVTLKDLAGQQVLLTRTVAHVVDRHDGKIADLQQRVTRLESAH